MVVLAVSASVVAVLVLFVLGFLLCLRRCCRQVSVRVMRSRWCWRGERQKEVTSTQLPVVSTLCFQLYENVTVNDIYKTEGIQGLDTTGEVWNLGR